MSAENALPGARKALLEIANPPRRSDDDATIFVF